MQVNLNINIKQSRPNFKASFSNTPETKMALKDIAKQDPLAVLNAFEALTQIPNEDVFTVTEEACSYKFKIINETLAKKSREKAVEYNPFRHSLLDKITHMHLSDGSSVVAQLPYNHWYEVDWKKGTTVKLNKKDNANFILEQVELNKKEIKKVEDKIEKLRDREDALRNKESNLLQHYANGVIDSLLN